MKKILMLIVILSILLMGCTDGSKKNAGSDVEKPQKDVEVQKLEEPKKEPPKKTPQQEYEELQANEVYSPLNGTKMAKEKLKQRPICVMFDNYYYARPQASLEMADIMYEALVEGQITRYMGVFQSQEPALIGPVRSARPYFLRLALEYDALYTHVGGSEAAKSDIKKLNIPDIDGLFAPDEILWREKHRKAPHNMYGSFKSFNQWADKMKYRKDYKLEPWKFGYVENAKEGKKPAAEFKIIYKAPIKGDEKGYYSGFKYDEKNGYYLRYVNGEPHVDEVSKEQLKAYSIIVQRADTRTLDNEGRLAVDLVGEGDGYYFHDGVMQEIKWRKKSDAARTEYMSADGEELTLVPGVLWVQIVPKSLDIATPEGEVIRIAKE